MRRVSSYSNVTYRRRIDQMKVFVGLIKRCLKKLNRKGTNKVTFSLTPVEIISARSAEKPPKPEKTSRVRLLFLVLSLVGFIWQIRDISSIYFKYSTVTELSIEVPKFIEPPALSACFYYPNLLSRSKVSKLVALKASANESLLIDHVQTHLSIKQIFDLTPSPEELINKSKCYFRYPNKYTRQYAANGNCSRHFKGKKYFREHYMCYQFEIFGWKKLVYNFHRLIHSLESPCMIYMLLMPANYFSHVDGIKLILHPSGEYPRISSGFSVPTFRNLNRSTGVAQFNEFYVNYASMKSKLLPLPYATKCKNYSATTRFDSRQHCVDDCVINQSNRTFGKFPFTALIDRPSNQPHISSEDLKNETFADILYRLEAKCEKNCHNANCFDEYFLSKVIRRRKGEEGFLTFRAYAPDQPNIETIFEPKISPSEFFLYIMSCFGIWFGWSAFHVISGIEYFRKRLIN